MSEHQNKATLLATYWCQKCGKSTLHNVADGRKAGCTICIDRPQPKQPDPPAHQERLF